MRPTLGKIFSGLALVAVTGSMLVMPERSLGTHDAAVQGLALDAPAGRTIVQAAPFRSKTVHRAAPISRPVIVVVRQPTAAIQPVAVAVSRRIPARPHAALPAPTPVRKAVAKRPPPPAAAAPPPAEPIELEVASVDGKKDKAKDDKPRKEKKPKKSRQDGDEGAEHAASENKGRDDDEHSGDHD